MTGKDDKGDQPSGGETTWTNTGATRYGRGQHKTGKCGGCMLRPLPNHGTQRLPNDDEHEQSRQCNGPSHFSATHKSEQTEYVYFLHTLGRLWRNRPLVLFTEFVMNC